MATTLKDTLRTDLTTAIRARDQVRAGTLRMALTAVTNAEVAGKEHRTLSDTDVLQVLAKEAKKRTEAMIAYADAGRPELAAREEAERVILEGYLPSPLTEAELAALVAAAIEQTGATGRGQMGVVMKTLGPQILGRADGAVVAALVRAALPS